MNATISSESQVKKLTMAALTWLIVLIRVSGEEIDHGSIDLVDCIVVNTISILATKSRHRD
jgi:hypothetical protein